MTGEGGAHPNRFDDEDEAAVRASLSSRLALFASPEVRDLFEAWLDVFAERWLQDFPKDQPRRLREAEAALAAQMRREFESLRGSARSDRFGS